MEFLERGYAVGQSARVAALAAEYQRWLMGSGEGTREPAQLLEGLAPPERDELLGAFDDINLFWALGQATQGLVRAIGHRRGVDPLN